jgi:Spy/CpxP family protein refolding chaperone
MSKLTPVFIAGALAISAGLAVAQSEMNKNEPMQGHKMPGHSMPVSDTPSTSLHSR